MGANMFTRNRMVAAAVAAALGTASANTFAQDANDPNADTAMEEVVVSGIRYGIESSIALKKNSESIVESVSAEDIGKLPDTSIAESISRLPGLAAQRVNGRAQVISIRGLRPAYGSTLLNGREMVSTGDNRSVELDQFLRAHQLRHRLQDTGRDAGGPGFVRHAEHADRPAAEVRQATARLQWPSRQEFERLTQRGQQ